jgi:hypothetical protein
MNSKISSGITSDDHRSDDKRGMVQMVMYTGREVGQQGVGVIRSRKYKYGYRVLAKILLVLKVLIKGY